MNLHSSEFEPLFDDFDARLKETANFILTELEGDYSQTELYKLQKLMKKWEESKRNIAFENGIFAEVKQYLDSLQKAWEVDVHKYFEDKVNSANQIKQTTNTSKGVDDFIDQLENVSVIVSEVRHNKTYKDPWTLKPIMDPVQSNTCKHFYERSIVYGVLKKKKEFRCPYIGCGQTIKQNNIIDVDF